MAKEHLTLWVNDYTDELYLWAVNKVSDVETAKDLVQETFLAAAKKIDSFEGKSSPKTWLFAILKRKIVDFYRQKIKQPLNSENSIITKMFDADGNWEETKSPQHWDENELDLLDDSNFMQVLKMCMDLLPDKWSTSVRLKYLLEKSGKEICQELGINPTNYWQMIHRAKLQLRECIEENWFKK